MYLLGHEHKFSGKFLKHRSNLGGDLSGFDSSLVSMEVQKATSLTPEWQTSLFFSGEGGRNRKPGDFKGKTFNKLGDLHCAIVEEPKLKKKMS